MKLAMIIISKYLVPKNYSGLTVYPFVFLKQKELKNDEFLLNHEQIHLNQQKELLWVFFFIWYFGEYLILLIQYKNHYKAYKNIGFERESYQNENNLNYLLDRKRFSFLKYIKK